MRMKYTLRLLAHVNHWNYYSIQEKNSSNIPFVCIPHLSLNIIIETISLARSLARSFFSANGGMSSSSIQLTNVQL